MSAPIEYDSSPYDQDLDIPPNDQYFPVIDWAVRPRGDELPLSLQRTPQVFVCAAKAGPPRVPDAWGRLIAHLPNAGTWSDRLGVALWADDTQAPVPADAVSDTLARYYREARILRRLRAVRRSVLALGLQQDGPNEHDGGRFVWFLERWEDAVVGRAVRPRGGSVSRVAAAALFCRLAPPGTQAHEAAPMVIPIGDGTHGPHGSFGAFWPDEVSCAIPYGADADLLHDYHKAAIVTAVGHSVWHGVHADDSHDCAIRDMGAALGLKHGGRNG